MRTMAAVPEDRGHDGSRAMSDPIMRAPAQV